MASGCAYSQMGLTTLTAHPGDPYRPLIRYRSQSGSITGSSQGREAVTFGDQLTPAASAAPAGWIRAACGGEPGTVAALLPNQFPSMLRVWAPDPGVDDWWDRYRGVFSIVASVAKRYTSTPDRVWFAVWEGHGFEVPPAQTVFELPDRSYYLMGGPAAAVDGLRYPGVDGWRNPDLIWPDDHRWFVATDVDFWSLYIGGDIDLVVELHKSVPTRTELVGPGTWLELEN